MDKAKYWKIFFKAPMDFVSLNCQVCQPEGREKVLLLLMLEYLPSDRRMPMMGRREIAGLLLCIRGPSLVTGSRFLIQLIHEALPHFRRGIWNTWNQSPNVHIWLRCIAVSNWPQIKYFDSINWNTFFTVYPVKCFIRSVL